MAFFNLLAPLTKEQVQTTLERYEENYGKSTAVYSILLWWMFRQDIPEGQSRLTNPRYVALSQKILNKDQKLITDLLNFLADKWSSFESKAGTFSLGSFIKSSLLQLPNPGQDSRLPLYHRHFSPEAIRFLNEYLEKNARNTITKQRNP